MDARDRGFGWAPFNGDGDVSENGKDLCSRRAKLERRIVPGGDVGW